MYIERVALESFRNIASLDLVLDQGFVVIVGKNGAGKTNFLEGIYYNLTLGRFPESGLGQLFREGKDFFRTSVALSEGVEREAFVQKTENSYQHQFKLNEKKVKRREFVKGLGAVSFLPQDLNLLTRAPGGRRRYLDETLSLAGVEYGHHLSNYQKTLKQRNDLLTSIVEGGADSAELEVWNEKLAEHGSFLTKMRQEFLGFVKENSAKVIKMFSPSLTGIEFVYQPSGAGDKTSFLKILSGKRKKELQLATTVAGPHRDDFRVRLDGKDAVGYISRGQMRAATLALKILETEYIEKRKQRLPALLLDDVLSEFDHEHQQRLLGFLNSLPQVFLTTAHLEEIEQQLPQKDQVFKIDQGEVSRNV